MLKECSLTLASLDDTRRLGRLLAALLREESAVRLCLLHGDLGSGKTTLARAVVEALPGGDRAEISSPTFTLCNSYPTCPPVLHADLYRCPGGAPDELWDALDDGKSLCLVEWGEALPAADLPKEYLDIRLNSCDEKHFVTLGAGGPAAQRLVERLQEGWPSLQGVDPVAL